MDFDQQNESTHTVEENIALCEKYPFLKWYGDPLYVGYDESEVDYTRTWEDELEPGWRKAFCPQMWDELKEILVEGDYLNEFRFMQIKEKWCTLRLYYCALPERLYDKVSEWAEKYFGLSEEYCIRCGKKPTEYMTLGWNTFVCGECKDKIQQESLAKYGVKERLVLIADLYEFYSDCSKYFETHDVE